MNKILSKLLFSVLAVLLTVEVMAQVPQGFNFQAVARDAQGDLIANSDLGVRVSILQGTETGTAVYTETQTPTSSAVGSFQLVIGEGTSEDDFNSIDWSADNYYVKLEIDPTGGTEYEELGTTRLLSVPYALVSQNVVNGISVGEEPITEFNLNSAQGDTSFIVNATGTTGMAAIRGNASTEGRNYGVIGTANTTASNTSDVYGVFGTAPGLGTGPQLGVLGSAINADGTGGRRYGIYGQARSQGRENIGAFGTAAGPGDGEVVLFGDPKEAEGNIGGYNVGTIGFAQGNLNGNLGARGRVFGTEGERINIGVQGFAETNALGENVGIESIVFNSQTRNIGFKGMVEGGGSPNFGIILSVNNGTTNVGAEINSSEVGLIVNAPTAADLNGTVNINGDLNLNGTLNETSDRNLKENIQPLQNGILTIMKLNPTTYNFRGNGDFNGLKLSTGLHYGLIAQEVEEVLPSLVKDNMHTYSEASSSGNGPDATSETEITKTMEYKTMNYTELIPVLIKGMQEQQTEIERQQTEINRLLKEVEQLKSNK